MSEIKLLSLNVPDLGDVEGIELATWNVQSGDSVKRDQELCELVTDKAAFPLESPSDGILQEIRVPAGQKVEKGETLAILKVTIKNSTPAD